MNQLLKYFNDFCSRKGLNKSKPRDSVVNAFLQTEHHISSYELYNVLLKQGNKIGYSTVYRTLKLLTEAGIARAIELGCETHFEHDYKHKHHDHFVCNQCGAIIEFSSPTIERIQDQIARKFNFVSEHHSLIIYGLCQQCQKK
ncbi:MAG: Fur family transcriptional regulator [candidate division WOR-3 bacterium]